MAKEIMLLEAMTMWCDPHRPNGMSGKVQCDLVRLPKDTVKELKSKGVNVNYDTKNDEDSSEYKGFWIRLKADQAVPMKDTAGNVLPSTLFIGNGTTLKAAFEIRDWFHKQSGKSGVKTVWLGARVQELVEYDPDAQAKEKADTLLDEVSGGDSGGFVFGSGDTGDSDEDQTSSESSSSDAELDALFGDDD
jgi:hypothetical protein